MGDADSCVSSRASARIDAMNNEASPQASTDPTTPCGTSIEGPRGAKTYAVQRRFDLATLFVMTTLFSIVFAIIRGLGGELTLGVLVAGNILVVGVAQAAAESSISPRRVSVYVGAAYWGVCAFFWILAAERHGTFLLQIPFALIQASFAAGLGAPVGYLAGAIAAGVFLIADILRNGWSPELLEAPRFNSPEVGREGGGLASEVTRLLEAARQRRPEAPPQASASNGDGSKSRIYAVERRFDLATLFVLTTAFCAVLALTRMWLSLVPGLLAAGSIAFVGLAQAVVERRYSPRGASMLAGMIYWSACYLVAVALWRWPSAVILIRLVFVAIAGGILGYLAGVAAAGVFLIADKLRRWSGQRDKPDSMQ